MKKNYEMEMQKKKKNSRKIHGASEDLDDVAEGAV